MAVFFSKTQYATAAFYCLPSGRKKDERENHYFPFPHKSAKKRYSNFEKSFEKHSCVTISFVTAEIVEEGEEGEAATGKGGGEKYASTSLLL